MIDILAVNIKTEPRLLDLINRAREHKMTPSDVFEQRVSFVYGQMNGVMTKDQVRAVLLKSEGYPDTETRATWAPK